MFLSHHQGEYVHVPVMIVPPRLGLGLLVQLQGLFPFCGLQKKQRTGAWCHLCKAAGPQAFLSELTSIPGLALV